MKHKWWERPIAVLDFETTGTDPLEARTVTVGLHTLDVDGKEAADPFDRVINPGIPIPVEASNVHGITTEEAVLRGEEPTAVLSALQLELEQVRLWGRPLCIFNARYDWTLLHTENRRHKLRRPPACPLLDPTIIDRTLDQYRRGGRRLEQVAAHYGVKLTGAHDAAADAIATAGVMRALVKAYPEDLQRPLEALQPLQARWFDQWRDGINSYWSKNGSKNRIEGGWPLFEPQTDLFPEEEKGA